MGIIDVLKEQEAPTTPLFLAQCTLTSGQSFCWSTHSVTVNGQVYAPRILKHNLFDLESSADQATDAISRVSLTLANADSFLSGVERSAGWKGANLVVQFLFYDLSNNAAASETQVLFNGSANPPDESTESYLRLSFTNRLALQRVFLPEVRIQKRCPWMFPTSVAQMTEAVDGGTQGQFSPFYRCGYSAGLPNGCGNLNNGAPFTSCDYSRIQCQQRGMFNSDSSGHVTSRFGGIEFVPASILVRPYGKSSQISVTLDNEGTLQRFRTADLRHWVVSASHCLCAQRWQSDPYRGATGRGSDDRRAESNRQRRGDSRRCSRREHDLHRLVQRGYPGNALRRIQSRLRGHEQESFRRSIRQHGLHVGGGTESSEQRKHAT